MANASIIGTDSPLTDTQRRSLDIVLDMIVPASADGSKPSAAQVDVLGYIRTFEADSLGTLGTELDQLDAVAKERHGSAFADLAAETRHALVAALRAAQPRFLRTLALQTVTCYYQDDRVLAALGMEARPPFPKGYSVPPGDLSLLEPVRQRGRRYRAVPDAP